MTMRSLCPASAAAIALMACATGAATLIGAWIFQYGFDIIPCPLCLEQRYAYYLAIPVAALTAFAAWQSLPRSVVTAGFVIVALAMLANAGLGTYHAGVEWGWWKGPTECSGPLNDLGSAGSLLSRLATVKVVRCDEVQWRFLGLSLAGYNVLISLAMAALAMCGLRAASQRRPA